jgi:hypothetical protein
MEALDDASKGVQAASTELSKLSQEFHEARVDPQSGELGELGTGLLFDIAIKDEIATIYSDAIQADPPRRPPAEDIREAMAHRAVQTKKPELWASYHTTKARIDALKTWISNQKSAISANQSILRGERA